MHNKFTRYLLVALLLGPSVFSEARAQTLTEFAKGPAKIKKPAKNSTSAQLGDLEEHSKVNIAPENGSRNYHPI